MTMNEAKFDQDQINWPSISGQAEYFLPEGLEYTSLQNSSSLFVITKFRVMLLIQTSSSYRNPLHLLGTFLIHFLEKLLNQLNTLWILKYKYQNFPQLKAGLHLPPAADGFNTSSIQCQPPRFAT